MPAPDANSDATKFTLKSRDEYSTNELAAALLSQGHREKVIVLDWSAPGGGRPKHLRVGDVDVMVLAPYALQGFGRMGALASKWVLSSLRARPV